MSGFSYLRGFFTAMMRVRPTIEFTFFSTELRLTVRTTTGLTTTLSTDDGSADAFIGEINKTYPNASRRTCGISIAQPETVDLLTIRSGGVVSLNGDEGIADFSAFRNLVAAALNGSKCTTFKANFQYSLDIDGTDCYDQILDVTEVNASQIRAGNSNCTSVGWPINAPGLSEIVLNGNRIAYPQVLPPMPSLSALYIANNGLTGGAGLGLLDLRNVPGLQRLEARESRINDIKTAPGSNLTFLNIIYCNFSLALNGVPGRPGSLPELVANCRGLQQFQAYAAGINRATAEGIFDVLLADDAGRARCQFLTGLGNVNDHWLSAGSITRSARANESIVTAAARTKLDQIRALGHYYEQNLPVFNVVILSDTSVRIDLISSDDDVTMWQVGDVINCHQSFNPDLMNQGDHTVLSGSGKRWVISNVKGYAGFIGNTGYGLFDRK
ncbi:hypothetical protein [Hymenobacter sp. YC55]|uniref:hypothetical protein n=1 Tax=Hymenobacter sp. YC55 TaxID=3034019 RepID=UPI0023F93FC1|nr:hypothetical protein [Hymenobacter sp. YC55]MDF7809902.1 hypothetical protein [Hymenobacter sp. YC55]